jgi:parallel beta-helix repeat protein
MGLKVRRNGIALISNSIVESNSGYGICACGTSFMLSESNTIRNNSSTGIYATDNAEVNIKSNTISGHSGGSSITITQGAYAIINSNTITGSSGNTAVEISRGSSATIKSNTIQSAYIGISVQDSSHAILKYNTVNSNSNSGLHVDNNASVILAEGNTFSNNSAYGIRVWLGGSLVMWGDAQLTSPTTISGNTKGPIRVDEGGSAYLRNLTLASQSKEIEIYSGNFVKFENVTLQGGEFGIVVWRTNIGLENSTISGHTDAEIYAETSTITLGNTAISGTAGSNEIKLTYGSKLFIGTGTTITGTVYCDGSVDNKSIGNWANLSLTTSGC